MMGLIERTGDVVKYGVGLDLMSLSRSIADNRSKVGAIFDYFDSMLVGLTAKRSTEVLNTYVLPLSKRVPIATSLRSVTGWQRVPPSSSNRFVHHVFVDYAESAK